MKKKYKTGQKALTEDNIDKLLNVITDLKQLGLIQLAIAGGIRREDIVRIKSNDVNPEDGSITFYEHKKKRTKKIYIPKTVMNTLEMIIKSNKKEEFLFPGKSESRYGKGHISGKTAYNIFNRYLKKADLDPRPFHALRASCMKLCQKRGWTPEQTAEHTGDTIKVIQEHYSTPSTEEMKETVNKKELL